MLERTYRYRIYPTIKQEKYFAQTADTVRALYNMMLLDRTNHYRKTGKWKGLDPAKHVKESLLMRDLHPSIINRTAVSLEKTYINFFRYRKANLDRYRPEALQRAEINPEYHLTDTDLVGYPKPKKKSSKESWDFGPSGILITPRRADIPGFGNVKIKIHRPIPMEAEISHFTVLRKSSGEYYLLIHLLLPDVPVKTKIETACGVAWEPGKPVRCSDGTFVQFRHQTQAQTEKLTLEHEKLHRKQPGSNRYEKQRRYLATLYEKRVNQRRDSLHNAAKEIVEKADFIITEEPAVKHRKRRLEYKGAYQTVSDEAWWLFSEFMKYKSQDAGKRFWRAPRALPIRDACSGCGILLDDRPRKEKWQCPYCGASLPATLNAAKNLEILGELHIKEQNEMSTRPV